MRKAGVLDMTDARRISVRDSLIVMGLLCILVAGEGFAEAGFAETGTADKNSALVQAEAMLDAFYAWNAVALAAAVEPTAEADRLLYYQAWAKAAHYTITRRQPCIHVDDGAIECRITVTDDFGQALGYVATDTFRLMPGSFRVASVTFAGNDPPIFEELFAWIRQHRPEVMSGPCKDLFDGGTTPADCARAVAVSARLFMKSRSAEVDSP